MHLPDDVWGIVLEYKREFEGYERAEQERIAFLRFFRLILNQLCHQVELI